MESQTVQNEAGQEAGGVTQDGSTPERMRSVSAPTPEPKLLSRDDILGITDLKYEIVDVPEWGGKVRVRGLRAAERDAYEASMVQQKGKDVAVNMVNVRAGLVARAICDAQGNRLFSDGDIALLGQKSAAALERVYEVAARLSTITDAAIEVLAGNSASDRSGAPSSA